MLFWLISLFYINIYRYINYYYHSFRNNVSNSFKQIWDATFIDFPIMEFYFTFNIYQIWID